MRIVCISDTHASPPPLPPGDILIHAGDATNFSSIQELQKFREWWDAQDYEYKLFIPGNHESEQYSDFVPIPNLHLKSTTIAGMVFAGCSFIPRLEGFPFYRPASHRRRVYQAMGKVDVLITHAPPFGILDRVKEEHLGCRVLAEEIENINPRLHVFGHIHEGNGVARIGNRIYVNASRKPITVYFD